MKGKRFLITAMFAMAAFLVAGNMVTAKSDVKVGDTIESFSLPDLEGKAHSLDSLKGEKGAVIVFLSAQCPVVKGYNERINQIAADYQAKGINFIGINSNSTEDLSWVKKDATEVGYKFPVLIDKGNALADKLGANVTPEVYFIDAKNVLLYHGAIDDSRSGKDIKINYLRTAFDDTLAGKKIERSSANAFGCSIKRTKKAE